MPIWLPHVDAFIEAAHDAGVDEKLRGLVFSRVDVGLVDLSEARFELWAGIGTWFRDNHRQESEVRLSPQQIRYPIGLRVRFPIASTGQVWGLFVAHQSNHDVDETNARLNRETISYEVYGVEWAGPAFRLAAGVYYDRGTTLSYRAQTLPFDYYLAGLQAAGETGLFERGYLAGEAEIIAHRNAEHDPGHFNLGVNLEVGARFDGVAATWRLFVRGARVEDYQWLGDEPRTIIMLGTSFSSRAPGTGRPRN